MSLKALPKVPSPEVRGRRALELLTKADIPVGLGTSPYYHWEQLRHRKPPEGLTVEEWWYVAKFRRHAAARRLPFVSAGGRAFWYCQTDRIDKALHLIDQKAAGSVAASGMPTDDMRLQYLIDGHIMEAITSAQLEGASTGHAVAASMLRSGSEPQDVDQRMILNTYKALRNITDMPDQLTVEGINQLHKMVTAGTLDDANDEGRFQIPSEDRVCVRDNRSGNTLHTPPPAKMLPKRMKQLCEFANESKIEKRFLHPVLRAICLHFWLAYDHPFVDGNGRAARMLYYWLAVNCGYWMLEYVPISSLLHQQPAKYGMAYQYVESDENDLTYFFEYQLATILEAMNQFLDLVHKRTEAVCELERKFKDQGFNHRQLSLLSHALRNPAAVYSVKTHATSHIVTEMTARKDLEQLLRQGYLQYGEPIGKSKTYNRNFEALR